MNSDNPAASHFIGGRMDVRSLFGLVVMAVLGSSVAGYSAPKAFVITTTDDGFSISVKKVQVR